MARRPLPVRPAPTLILACSNIRWAPSAASGTCWATRSFSDNPDSWEGWHWGATHAWGYYWKLGVSDNFDMLEEALKHTEQIVFWGVDPNTTRRRLQRPGRQSLASVVQRTGHEDDLYRPVVQLYGSHLGR